MAARRAAGAVSGREVAGAGHDRQRGAAAEQRLGLLGQRERRGAVVVAPHERDRARDPGKEVGVVLVDGLHQHVAHDAVRRCGSRRSRRAGGGPPCARRSRGPCRAASAASRKEALGRARRRAASRGGGRRSAPSAPICPGRLAARCTATRPPKEWPTITTSGAHASSAGATSLGVAGGARRLAGAPAWPRRSRGDRGRRRRGRRRPWRSRLRVRIQPGRASTRAGPRRPARRTPRWGGRRHAALRPPPARCERAMAAGRSHHHASSERHDRRRSTSTTVLLVASRSGPNTRRPAGRCRRRP